MSGTPEFLDGDAVRMINPCSHVVEGRRRPALLERMSLVAALTAFLALTFEEICDLRLPRKKIVAGTVLEIAGTRPRNMPLVSELEIAIRRYRLVRPDFDSPYLLLSAEGAPLSPSLLWQHYRRMGWRGGFDGGQVQSQLRRWCVASLENHPDVDFDVLRRFEGYHKEGTSRNPLPEVSPAQMRKMLLACHPLCGMGETLFDPEASFAWLADADQNLPEVPARQRVILGLGGDAVSRVRPAAAARVVFARGDRFAAPDEAQLADPHLARLFSTPWPIDVRERERLRGHLAREHRPRLAARMVAGELAPEQVALLMCMWISTAMGWRDAPPPELAETSVRELERLLAEGIASVAALRRHLVAAGETVSERMLRAHLRARKLGPYAEIAPPGEARLADAVIALLFGTAWPIDARERKRLRERLSCAHRPRLVAAMTAGELTPDQVALLLCVRPETAKAWRAAPSPPNPKALASAAARAVGALETGRFKVRTGGRRRRGELDGVTASDHVVRISLRLAASPPQPMVPPPSARLLADPVVGQMFEAAWPVDPAVRRRFLRSRDYLHRRRAVALMVAAELTAEQVAALFGVREATAAAWRDAGVPPPRKEKNGRIELSAEAAAEVARLLGCDGRLPVPAVRRGLAAIGVDVSEHVVRMHMKRHGLGRFAAGVAGPFPRQAVLEHERGDLPPDDATVRALAAERWPERTVAREIHKRRLRRRHLPRVRALVEDGRLSEAAAAGLFCIKPDTMGRWIVAFDAALAARAAAPGKASPKCPPRAAPDAVWAARIEALFAAEPGISGLAAHARLRDRGYLQSYFVMYRFAKERGLVTEGRPEPVWLVRLAELRERHPRVKLKVLHRGQAAVPGWPSYMTVLRHARRVGLAAPRPVGPKSAEKRAKKRA